MICLFDTSALVKLVVQEPDSDTTTALWSRTLPTASRLAQPELASALSAAHRAGRLDRSDMRAVERRVDAIIDGLIWVELGSEIARLAARLASLHLLSGADAVHVATAISLGEGGLVATFDERLRTASIDLGLAVFPSQIS